MEVATVYKNETGTNMAFTEIESNMNDGTFTKKMKQTGVNQHFRMK